MPTYNISARQRRAKQILLLKNEKETITMRITRDFLYSNGTAYRLLTLETQSERLYELYKKKFITLEEYNAKQREFAKR